MIKIGRYVIPLWLVAVLLFSGITVVVAVYFVTISAVAVLPSAIMPFEVKEPLGILSYSPSEFSLFPGETENITVVVQNRGSLEYLVILDFQLNDTAYQANYVKSSKEIYNVTSGQQELAAWLMIEPDAPATNATLTINVERLKTYESTFPTTIKIEAYPTTDTYSRSHGLSIDEPLPKEWWNYPGYEFKITGQSFVYETIEYLEMGAHFVEYASSGYITPDLAWHARIYINDILIAEGDVGRDEYDMEKDTHLRAYFNVP